MPYKLRSEIEKQVQSVLDKSVVRPSTSPWAAPVLLVPKLDSSWHFCVNYRKLNSVLVKSIYPMKGTTADTLHRLSHAKVFFNLRYVVAILPGGSRRGLN